MNSEGNFFENLIDSFKAKCSSMEKKAELDLFHIEKECEEDFASSVESLQKFNEIMAGISEVLSEVINTNDILKIATKKSTNKNVINLPYEMHSDVVKCINNLYNMPPIGGNDHCQNLLINTNGELLNDLIRIGEKNINDLKDIENTITEAKEIY